MKRIEDFPSRQRQVVDLVADGLTYQQIAERLYMSVSTVRCHVAKAMGDLGLTGSRGRLAAAVWQGRLAKAVADERAAWERVFRPQREAS